MWALTSGFRRATVRSLKGSASRSLVESLRVERLLKAAKEFSTMRLVSRSMEGKRGNQRFGSGPSPPSRSLTSSRTVAGRMYMLEKEANKNPNDADKQRKYYEALLRDGAFRRIVTRFDSNRYATTNDISKLYVRACIQLGLTHKIDRLMDSLPAEPVGPGGEYSYTGSSSSAQAQSRYYDHEPHRGPMGMGATPLGGAVNGTEQAPVVVQLKKETLGERLFNSFLYALSFLVVAAAITIGGTYIASDRLPAVGRNRNQNEVSPSDVSSVSFEDVMGCKEAKMELQEIVEFLKNPEKFTRLGGELPRGVLLMGPPGTGKTLLAKAVAGEAGVPFFTASGSEFEEMYVGVGARRVRDLFAAAKDKSPCLIFIDEIDAIGGSRKAKEQQSMRLTLNQLLVELDGFNTNSGIIVLAATNFPAMLDKALTRAGRFDRHITVPLPDIRGRTEILDLYTSKLPLGNNVDCKVLARGTPGYSGADLSTMVNDAAIHASMRGSDTVSQEDFEYAKDKMFMGPERKSAYLDPESRRLTAYHEGGHAIVAMHTDGAHPVHKATIMPRGNALGMVFQLPAGDQTSVTRKQLIAEMDVCMGGRAAEEMVFGRDNVTTGASSDMRRATQIARAMVLKYGMSDKVGVIDFDQLKDSQMSSETRKLVDAEIKSLLDNSYERVTDILQREKPKLERLADALIKHETLTGDDIRNVINGKGKGSSI
eukprot:CAMPEP_0197531648 /NCGR_PEP_ID=MMETSP1318-20131121/36488_1 /TAXON_ID=552666 /ORGANISM="Partenskyella glossopodia, Strain RCC365" /LENGTH=708 /DNA_ID=CAMNT_0043087937 /DNA_START=88 /DNA_END=2214 /DNA_ORIENTATION=+